MTKKEKEEINELLSNELTYNLGMKKIVELLNIKSISTNSHSGIDDFVGFKITIHNRYTLLDIFLFETYSEFNKAWKLLSRLSVAKFYTNVGRTKSFIPERAITSLDDFIDIFNTTPESMIFHDGKVTSIKALMYRSVILLNQMIKRKELWTTTKVKD
jgi:hypothetical protein